MTDVLDEWRDAPLRLVITTDYGYQGLETVAQPGVPWQMAGHQMKSSGARSDLPQAVIDLAQDDPATIESEPSVTGAAEIQLALADLISDANGELVVFNDSGFRTMAIRTEAAVTADGRVQRHTTASGEDVSGFNYVTFDNGVTLYYPDGLDLILEPDGTRSAG